MAKEIDPQDLVAQEAAHAEQVEKLKELRGIEVADFKWLMGDKRGRRFVWRLLEKAGVFRCSFRPDNEMAFLEGMRNHGVMLFTDIHEICPEKYHIMVKEQQENADRQ